MPVHFPWRPPALDAPAAHAASVRQDSLTKPRGSLGHLETIPAQLAALQGDPLPRARPAACLLFASDHPVARRGVSAYPIEVTAAMLRNFATGGAAASVLAASLGVPLRVLDVGVTHAYALPPDAAVAVERHAVSAMPAGDLAVEDAMPLATYAAALQAGAEAVAALTADTRVLVLGEMGIGNSTAAAAVSAAILGVSADMLVGPGTGVHGDALARKREAVAAALRRLGKADPHRAVQGAGGREIAALLGAMAAAVAARIAVVVDGFIVVAAALALVRLDPGFRAGLLFGHRSAEPGHELVLQALEARPLLDLGLRLGEGSGALLALPLVDAACALHRGMATFADAGVPDRRS